VPEETIQNDIPILHPVEVVDLASDPSNNRVSQSQDQTIGPPLPRNQFNKLFLDQLDPMVKEARPKKEIIRAMELLNEKRCATPFPADEFRRTIDDRIKYLKKLWKKTKKAASQHGSEDEPPILEFTDDGLAQEFSTQHGDTLKYIPERKRWFHWTDNYWKPDKLLMTVDRVRRFARAKAGFAIGKKNGESIAEYLLSASTIASIERLARSDPRHATPIEQWDSNPWIIATPLGVVDLKTGMLRDARPEDYCSKITSVGPEGDCPNWLKFLGDVTGGDLELQKYLQRLFGYALTGSTQEHALFFIYGPGGNGKSTLLEAIRGVMGDYAAAVPLGALVASNNDRHPTELAKLHGSRIAIANEIESSSKWDEVRIKSLTGGDKVTARFMRQDFFEYQPEFKLVIAGNNKPRIQKVDDAIRRRFHMIPFTVPITNPDKDLPDKLRNEWPGILRWMIEGSLEWQTQGLNPPQSVLAATNEYLTEEDDLGQWLEECCELKPAAEEPSASLFNSWQIWCRQNGVAAGVKGTFIRRLKERPGLESTRIGHKSDRGVKGVRLKAETCEDEDSTPRAPTPVAQDLF
jgi:putative DNA primase/helicase